MFGAEHLLADRQRALVERPRARKVALVLEQEGEIVEALRRVGMLGPKHLLADRQRALVERPALCVGRQSAMPVISGELEQISGALLGPRRNTPIGGQGEHDRIEPPDAWPSL